MKGKKTRSSAKRPGIQFLLAAGCGCGVCLALSLLCAALIGAQLLPQAQDVIYTSVILAVGTFLGCKLAARAMAKWAGALGICACYLGLMLVGNLCLAQPDLELILLNSGILCGAALLALLPMPQRRRGYRVRY